MAYAAVGFDLLTARQPTATLRRARRPWPPSRKADGESRNKHSGEAFPNRSPQTFAFHGARRGPPGPQPRLRAGFSYVETSDRRPCPFSFFGVACLRRLPSHWQQHVRAPSCGTCPSQFALAFLIAHFAHLAVVLAAILRWLLLSPRYLDSFAH